MKIRVIFFNGNTQQRQYETFGLIHCAMRFAHAIEKSAEHRLIEVYDVYAAKSI